MHAERLRQGWTVNHQCVRRWMRADNRLCLRRRKFIRTIDSKHGLPIYPNLVGAMVLTGIDQLWVADITSIRLQVEFVDLAVLLDAFSRRCIGWALQRTLEAALVREALPRALTNPDHSLVGCTIRTAAGNRRHTTTRHNANHTAFVSACAGGQRRTTTPQPRAS